MELKDGCDMAEMSFSEYSTRRPLNTNSGFFLNDENRSKIWHDRCLGYGCIYTYESKASGVKSPLTGNS